jgi:hypothetical protein
MEEMEMEWKKIAKKKSTIYIGLAVLLVVGVVAAGVGYLTTTARINAEVKEPFQIAYLEGTHWMNDTLGELEMGTLSLYSGENKTYAMRIKNFGSVPLGVIITPENGTSLDTKFICSNLTSGLKYKNGNGEYMIEIPAGGIAQNFKFNFAAPADGAPMVSTPIEMQFWRNFAEPVYDITCQ